MMSCMDIVYSHWLALDYWRRVSARGALGSLWGLVPVTPEDTASEALPRRRAPIAMGPPTSSALDRLDAHGLLVRRPIELLVSKGDYRRALRDTTCHVCAQALPPRSLHPIIARGRRVPDCYVCAPELAFVQVAPQLGLSDLVMLGLELCGKYRRVRREDGEEEVAHNCPPLTSQARLAKAVDKAGGMRGRAQALRAVPWVLDGSGSVAEAVLATLFTLPWRYGGENLGKALLNPCLPLDGPAATLFGRDEITPDILFVNPRYPVEYDSAQFHSTQEQAEFDERRRNAYAALGLGCTVVRPHHLRSLHRYDAIAGSLRINLGRRIQRRPESYDAAHSELVSSLLEPWMRRRGGGSPEREADSDLVFPEGYEFDFP